MDVIKLPLLPRSRIVYLHLFTLIEITTKDVPTVMKVRSCYCV